jgi:hypothetical protein
MSSKQDVVCKSLQIYDFAEYLYFPDLFIQGENIANNVNTDHRFIQT